MNKKVIEHGTLPCIVAWAMWWAKNDVIFHGKNIPIQVCHQVRYAYSLETQEREASGNFNSGWYRSL
jgi:hypothetical protein